MLRLVPLILLLAVGVAAATPVPAELGVFVVDVMSLDERNGTFQIELDIISRWHDPARAFAGDGPRTLLDDAAIAEMRRGWWPALDAMNKVGNPSDGLIRLTISPDGTMVVRARMLMELRASLDFRQFPFDTQVLLVRVESLMRPSTDLSLSSAAEFTGFDEYFDLPEWTVVGLTTEQSQVLRARENATYDRLDFQLTVERNTGYYIWKIMLPMIIIVILSWVVFWMSGEMLGRRAGISSTGMLTIIAYQFVVAGSLPRFPYLTVMDRFTLISLLVIAATMLVNLVSSALSEELRLRLDRTCRVAFPVGYALVVYLVLTLG